MNNENQFGEQLDILMGMIKDLQKSINQKDEIIAQLTQIQQKKEGYIRKTLDKEGMKAVEPFRTEKDIHRMKAAMKTQRDIVLYTIGINTNLRISDLLTLQKRHFNGTHIELHEQKTKKLRKILINDEVRAIVEPYIANMNNHDYLFPAQGEARSHKPMSRQAAEQMLSNAALRAGIKYRVGCHSLRKTWGYHQWKNGTHLAVIQEAYNHTDLKATRRYLGITQDDLDAAYRKSLGNKKESVSE